MVILPAIDIKDGNCVRLFKGDYGTVQKVATWIPRAVSKLPARSGFTW